MLVTLFNFSKRENSTKQIRPTDLSAKQLQVQLKDECNLTNPVLLVSPNLLSGTFSPTAFNYASIPYWERYYFIKNWTYKNGVWECELAVDVLASFKSSIGQLPTYIERSSFAYDGNIIDNLYPAKDQFSIAYTSLASAWYGVAPSGGSYIIGVLNYQSSNHIGSVAYYACTQAQLNSLLNYLFSGTIYGASNIEEIGQGLYEAMFNPIQYITSCIWFPFSTATFGSTSTNIKIGYWDTTVNAIMVSNVAHKTFITGNIPDHPQASSRGNFLNYSPYSEHSLYIPPFGSFTLDNSFKSIGKYVYSAVVVDHITGEATIRISTCPSSSNLNEFYIQEERSVMLGVPIQIAQIMVDTGNLISTGAGVIGGIVSSIGDAIGSSLLQSVGNAAAGFGTKVNSVGANGSFISQILTPTIVSKFVYLVEEDKEELGRPLCQSRQINTLSGYIKCANADHEFSCTADERSMINSYMKDGFFYE